MWVFVSQEARIHCRGPLFRAWVTLVLLAKDSELITALGMMPKRGYHILCPVTPRPPLFKTKASSGHLISKLLSAKEGIYLNNTWCNWLRAINISLRGHICWNVRWLSLFNIYQQFGWRVMAYCHGFGENWQELGEIMLLSESRVENGPKPNR